MFHQINPLQARQYLPSGTQDQETTIQEMLNILQKYLPQAFQSKFQAAAIVQNKQIAIETLIWVVRNDLTHNRIAVRNDLNKYFEQTKQLNVIDSSPHLIKINSIRPLPNYLHDILANIASGAFNLNHTPQYATGPAPCLLASFERYTRMKYLEEISLKVLH